MPVKPAVDVRLSPRRAEICRAAARIFNSQGFDATSVSDIARALGMTKAGLYHYFRSKEDLLLEIMMFGLDRLRDEVIVPTRTIADPVERLRQIVVRHARISTRAHGAVARLTDETRALPPPARRKVRERQRQYFDLMRGTLADIDAAGRLRDVDLTAAAFSVIGMILWLPRWFRPGRRLGNEQAAVEISNLAVAALVSPARGRRPDVKTRAIPRPARPAARPTGRLDS